MSSLLFPLKPQDAHFSFLAGKRIADLLADVFQHVSRIPGIVNTLSIGAPQSQTGRMSLRG
jgi:hypothetical protein